MRYLHRGLTVWDKERASSGFTLFTPLDLPNTYLIDMAGKVVHEWKLPGKTTNYSHLLANGNLLTATKTDESLAESQAGGLIQELDWDGNVVWEYFDPNQHHDFRRCPNGNTLYVAWEVLPEEHAARVRGGRPDAVHERGILGDYVREVDPNGETVWEWHAYEHMEIEKYPLHPDSNRFEFAHPNTIVPLPDGNAMICFRHIDLLAVIERATGALSWTWHEPDLGGPHDFQRLENGNFMVFANRAGLTPTGSAVLEFEPKTRETVWRYQANPSHTFDSRFISGCQRLPGGNTLICEGIWGRIFEVTPEGDVVWEFISPYVFNRKVGPAVGDVSFVFRAYRYAPDGPELRGRAGTPD